MFDAIISAGWTYITITGRRHIPYIGYFSFAMALGSVDTRMHLVPTHAWARYQAPSWLRSITPPNLSPGHSRCFDLYSSHNSSLAPSEHYVPSTQSERLASEQDFSVSERAASGT